ncbi:MAG TPA: uroporphyrinogen decarboxylase family protein [bacterium]|nr:uroporphyrinogen decarboxylase family protein [bacterium]
MANSRTKVLNNIEHKSTSHTPVDIGSSLVSGLHVSHIAQLRKYFNLPEKPIQIIEPSQMLGKIDKDLKEFLRIDTTGVVPFKNIFGIKNQNWREWQLPSGQKVEVPGNFNTQRDEQGNLHIFPEGNTNAQSSGLMSRGQSSFELISRQMQGHGQTHNPKDNLQEFQIISDEELDYLEDQLEKISKENRAVIFTSEFTFLGNSNYILAPYLKNPAGIRNLTDWYMALQQQPNYIHKVFEEQTKIGLENLAIINNRMGDLIDIILVCATDFGGQDSLLISPRTFRKLFKPFYKQINSWIHANTNWKTMKHSCGAIAELIPDLIECGFDILNPLHFDALNMSPGQIKKNYGGSICFWGNCLDMEVMISGQLSQIEEEAHNCITLSQKGGFVFSLENLPVKTPIKNMITLIKALP